MPQPSSRQGGSVLPLLLVLYVAQSIPMAFCATLLPLVLRQEAYSLTQIALLQLIKLPWILKFAWAPWVDRRTMTMGSLRRTIVLSEAVYALFLLGMSWLSIDLHLVPILICMLLSFVASSVQDIAVDKFAIRSLRPETRSLGNAMQSGGNFLGSLIGAGLIVALYHYAGWRTSVLILTLIVLAALAPLSLWSRQSEQAHPQAQPTPDGTPELEAQAVQPPSTVKTLVGYYKSLPNRAYLVGLMLFFSPIMPLMVLIKPMLIDCGFELQTVAMLLGVWGAAVAAGASFGAGAMLRRLDRSSVLRTIYILAALVGGLFVFLAQNEVSLPLAMVAIAALWGVYALSSVCLYTLSMGRVRSGSEGTDFTLQTISAQLGGMLVSAGVGALADALGYAAAFGLMVALALALSLLAPRLLPTD